MGDHLIDTIYNEVRKASFLGIVRVYISKEGNLAFINDLDRTKGISVNRREKIAASELIAALTKMTKESS